MKINKMKNTVVLLMICVSVSGISQKTSEIVGKMKKARGEMVYLQHEEKGKIVTVDSSKVNFFGKYKLQAPVVLDDFYRITMDKKESILLLLKGDEKIKIESDKDFSNKEYTVKGSEDSKLIQEYFAMKATKDITKDSVGKYADKFVVDNAKSLAIFIALADVRDAKKAITAAEKGIGESYPNSIYHNSLKNALKQINQPRKAPSRPQGLSIGSMAPELNMVSPEGKIITLESLRGKYVLIDFWASWCGPCRRENPNVVKLYNKYKDKGFDVYSVSLDKSKSRWVGAIKQDRLTWPNHVSDLKGWGSAATRLYGFRGIPYTVLIDKEGKIIATRLRGAALERKLESILGK